MARNTIQKVFTTTTVKGFIIKDGVPVEASYELDKKCGINTAQYIVRQHEPTFAATDIVENSILYKMTFDEFKAHAHPVTEAE